MNLWFDLKYAWRLLLKSPGHSLLCIVVIALSVGLALWAYVCAYTMAFKPLGFPGSERWHSVQIAADTGAVAQPTVDAFTYQNILDRTRSVDHLGAFASRAVVLSADNASTRLRAAAISPRLLAATAVKPHLGRLFEPRDSDPAGTATAILSFETWRNYFASSGSIIGKQVRIDSQLVQVIGVMPRGFFAFEDDEIWLPLRLPRLADVSDSMPMLTPFILAVDADQVRTAFAEIKIAVDEVTQNHPQNYKSGRHVELIVGHRWDVQASLQIITMCVFIASGVLLMGGVNISMVFLARLLERSRELALRTALGATRSRLLRQCLLETASLAILGLLGGYTFAAFGLRWSQNLTDIGTGIMAQGRWFHIPALKPSDVWAAILITVGFWLLSTLIPAWRVAKQDAAIALSGNGKGAVGIHNGKTTRALVGLQVFISCLVLVICANMVFSVRDEVAEPTGLQSAHVILSTYPTSLVDFYTDANERSRYFEELAESATNHLAGATIALASAAPTSPVSVDVLLDHQVSTSRDDTLQLPLAQVSDNYFDLLGIKRIHGRMFDSTDNESAPQVAILDEQTAKRFWPNQNVIGQRLQLNPKKNGPWLTIVGVVSHVRRTYMGELGVIYQPLRQSVPTIFHTLAKLPTSTTDHSGTVALRAAAFAVNRDVALHNLRTLDDYLYANNLVYEMFVPGFTVMGAITALLAASGLFGLISRSVAQRTQEIGVRRALGGTRWQASKMFLRQGVFYLFVGIAGLVLGIVVTNLISASVPNILARAASVTAGVLTLISLVIFLASYLPTRRAVALEPGDALRYE